MTSGSLKRGKKMTRNDNRREYIYKVIDINSEETFSRGVEILYDKADSDVDSHNK